MRRAHLTVGELQDVGVFLAAVLESVRQKRAGEGLAGSGEIIAGVFLCSKHLVSVLNWTPVPERGLAAFLVVITYIFIYCFFEFIKAIVNLPIVHLLLHYPEEVLHWRIVVTITFAGHALEYAIILQFLTVNAHLVCPSTV